MSAIICMHVRHNKHTKSEKSSMFKVTLSQLAD